MLQKIVVSFLVYINLNLFLMCIVALDASGEPVKKQGNLEKHCGWLYTKLYVFSYLLIIFISD